MARYLLTEAKVKEFKGSDEEFTFNLKFDTLNMPHEALESFAVRQMKVDHVNRTLRPSGRDNLLKCQQAGTVLIHWSEIGKAHVPDEKRREEIIKQVMLMKGCTHKEAIDEVVKMLEGIKDKK
jgi:hypothetical protein